MAKAKNKTKFVSDARKESKKGKYDKATELYEKALEEDPNDYNLWITLGDTYVKAEKTFDAVKSYESAASICQKEGILAPAIAIYKKITRARPAYSKAYLVLGELYGERRLYKDAIDNYSRYADLMLEEKNIDEVLNSYKAIVELAPKNPTIRSKLAELYVSQGHMDEAVNELNSLRDLYQEIEDTEKVAETDAKIKELGAEPGQAPPPTSKPADKTETVEEEEEVDEGGGIKMDMDALSVLGDDFSAPKVAEEKTPPPPESESPKTETSPPAKPTSSDGGIDLSGLDGVDLSVSVPPVEESEPPAPEVSSGAFEISTDDLPSVEGDLSDETMIGDDLPGVEAPPEPETAKEEPPEEQDAADILAGFFGDAPPEVSDEQEPEEDEEPEPEPEEEEVKEEEKPEPKIEKKEEEHLPTTIAEATKMLEENPKGWHIYIVLGELFEEEAHNTDNFDLIMNAAVVYQRSAEGYESEDNSEGAANAYVHWIKISKEIDSPDTLVQNVLQKLSRFAQEVKDNKITAQIYEQIALSYFNDHDYESASVYYQKMVESAYSVMEKNLISEGYLGLAKVLIQKNDIQKARHRLETALKFTKNHNEATQLLMKIDMGEIGAAEPTPAPPSTIPSPPKPTKSTPKEYVSVQDWFHDEDEEDIEVIDIRQDAPDFMDSDSVEDIIKGFRAGLEEQFDEDDYAMRYDLGVAYKEMGLLDEAISEFQKATGGGEQQLKAYENIGVCFLEKNEPRFALRQLIKGLQIPGYPEEQYIGLRYYMGRAYEELGEIEKAMGEYEEVYVLDVSFKDVQERRDRLEKLKKSSSGGSSGGGVSSESSTFVPPGALPPTPTPSSDEPAAPTMSSLLNDDDDLVMGDDFFEDDDLEIPALDGLSPDKKKKEDKKKQKPKKAQRDKRISFI